MGTVAGPMRTLRPTGADDSAAAARVGDGGAGCLRRCVDERWNRYGATVMRSAAGGARFGFAVR
jgi:hypothetical protein